MFDNNLIVAPRPLADNGIPIVLNNACASWHRLANTFAFCNARAYIGTLFGVSNAEAQDVAMNLLDRHFGKPLALALWHAQKSERADQIDGSDVSDVRTTLDDYVRFLNGEIEGLRRHFRAAGKPYIKGTFWGT